MSEFAPAWSNARMTKSQVRKYIAEMNEAKKIAQEKLENAKINWEFQAEKNELLQIEKELDNL